MVHQFAEGLAGAKAGEILSQHLRLGGLGLL